MKEYLENDDGVHLIYGEYSMCGDAYDIGETEEEVSPMVRTSKRVVTCPRCIAVIVYCRKVIVRDDGLEGL